MKTLRDKQKLAEESWEGCDGCTEQDKLMWKNGFIHGYNAAEPGFVHKVNWEMLKQQKSDLLTLINSESCNESDLWKNIQGIVYVIDALQDYAVDVLGMDENVVFNL